MDLMMELLRGNRKWGLVLGSALLGGILLSSSEIGPRPAFGSPSGTPIQELQDRLQGVMDAFHSGGTFPGASAAVSLPDGTVRTVTVGKADTVRHLPMTPDGRMLQG